MYCPNCGVKLAHPNQKFCHNCGTELVGAFEQIEIRREKNHYESIPTNQIVTAPPVYQSYYQKQVKISGLPRPYSKKSLAYSIVSLGLFVIGVYLGNPMVTYFFNYLDAWILSRIKLILIIC